VVCDFFFSDGEARARTVEDRRSSAPPLRETLRANDPSFTYAVHVNGLLGLSSLLGPGLGVDQSAKREPGPPTLGPWGRSRW